MTKQGKFGRLIKRFLTAAIETHLSVIGDIAGVYITFSGEDFVTDLMIYQIQRKISSIGLRDTLITFLISDQGFRSMIGFN